MNSQKIAETLKVLRTGNIAQVEAGLIEDLRRTSQKELYDKLREYFLGHVLDWINHPEYVSIFLEAKCSKRLVAVADYRGTKYRRVLRWRKGLIVTQ